MRATLFGRDAFLDRAVEGGVLGRGPLFLFRAALLRDAPLRRDALALDATRLLGRTPPLLGAHLGFLALRFKASRFLRASLLFNSLRGQTLFFRARGSETLFLHALGGRTLFLRALRLGD